MSRSPNRRTLLGELRRMLRRRRAPHPSEQEWLRLILLVRKMQRNQHSLVQRLDEVRALTGALTSFRAGFGGLEQQLGHAHLALGELERGIARGLKHYEEHGPGTGQALEERMARLDGLAERLESLVGTAAARPPYVDELGERIAEVGGLIQRMEQAAQSASATGGQDELASLYSRIEELAEGLAQAPPAPGTGFDPEPLLGSLEARCLRLDDALERLESAQGVALHAAGQGGQVFGAFHELSARFEDLARRLEQVSQVVPELPAGSLPSGAIGAEELAGLEREIEDLRTALGAELETSRNAQSQLEAQQERLRAAELRCMELESSHTLEVTQMADHARARMRKLEDDIKKKKRGLSELTQQNIQLQNEVNRLRTQMNPAASKAGPDRVSDDPPAPFPHREASRDTSQEPQLEE